MNKSNTKDVGKERSITKHFNIQKLFKLMIETNASDLHLTVDAPPCLRVNGSISRVKTNPLTPQNIEDLIYQILSKSQRSYFEKKMELDFSFEIRKLARFRGNVFYSKGAISASFRIIPTEIPNFELLGLPHILLDMTQVKNGIILVSGETGSGKSTTLAAILDHLNSIRNGHIITLEDPIEFVHPHKKCIINQREVGKDSKNFASSLKGLLRQDPDIILIGEMRDSETIQAALTMAETGHLVFGTIHTNSCVQTITRLINSFPPHQQEQIRTVLSFSLQGVISQQLISKSFESGRVVALEILIPNLAIKNLIRENNIHQIYSQMQIGQNKTGMTTMNQSLEKLVSNGSIDQKTAIERSTEPEELIKKWKL